VDPIVKTAEELGINKSTLHTWISKYHSPHKQKASQVEETHLYDEIKILCKENKRLKGECDILKSCGVLCEGKQASPKTFAIKSSEASGLSFKELLHWVEVNNLV